MTINREGFVYSSVSTAFTPLATPTDVFTIAAVSASFPIGVNAVSINNPQVAGDSAGNLIGVHYSADCDLT